MLRCHQSTRRYCPAPLRARHLEPPDSLQHHPLLSTAPPSTQPDPRPSAFPASCNTCTRSESNPAESGPRSGTRTPRLGWSRVGCQRGPAPHAACAWRVVTYVLRTRPVSLISALVRLDGLFEPLWNGLLEAVQITLIRQACRGAECANVFTRVSALGLCRTQFRGCVLDTFGRRCRGAIRLGV